MLTLLITAKSISEDTGRISRHGGFTAVPSVWCAPVVLGMRCSNWGEERALIHLPVSTLLKCQGDWLPCLSHLSLLKLSSSLKKNNKQQSRNVLLLAAGEQMFNLNCEVNVVS